MHNFTNYKLSCLFNVIFSSVKKMIFCSIKRNGWCWKSSTRMLSTLWQCQIIWNICKFYHHNLVFSLFYTIHEKICFLQKIWFLKNSTRVVKYESWVVKLNPAWLSRFWWKINYSAPDPHKLFTLVKTPDPFPFKFLSKT